MLSCIYHGQPSAHTASALPHTDTSPHHRPRPRSNTHRPDLAKVNVPTFDADVFAGIGEIGLDWPASWQHGLTPPTGLLAGGTSGGYFQNPDFSPLRNCGGERGNTNSTEQRCPGSSEAPAPSSVYNSTSVSSGHGDNRWEGTLRQIPKINFLVQGMTRSLDCTKKHPVLPFLAKDQREGDNGLRLPPLVDVVIKLEHQAQLDEEQNNNDSLTRLSPLLKDSSKIQQLLPPRHACKKLVNAYFETFGSVLCILDTTAFFNDLERFWVRKGALPSSTTDHEEAHYEAFSHKLLVVVALGSITCPGSTGGGSTEAERTRQTGRRNHAIVCVQYTRQWLAQKTARGIRADLDIAQILCLLALARQTQLHTEPWPRRQNMEGAIILTGDHDLARLGMQMGLHREPGALPNASPVKEAEAELRRRLWATMLELSLHQYLDAELPPPLGPESFDCAAPSTNEHGEDLRSHLTTDYQCAPASAMLAALSRTQRLRLRILQHLHAPTAMISSQESQRLAIELNQSCNAEMNNLLLSGVTQPTTSQLWFLNILTRPFILALNAHLSTETENKATNYYFRSMRMEAAISILRAGLHSDGSNTVHPQTPSHSSWAGSRNKTAATYPFLPTPSTAEPCNTGTGQQDGMHKATYAALYAGGPSYYAGVHRQVVATLCADVIAEIQEDMFPTLNANMLHKVVAILEDVVTEYQEQVQASGGIHACHEFVLFAAAQSFALALLNRSGTHEVDKSIMSSVRTALHYCCKAMGEPAEGILEMEWEAEAIEAAAKVQGVTARVPTTEQDGEAAAEMQGVGFVLDQQDGLQSLDAPTADTEIANMWAFDDDESYFSIDITL